MGRIQNLDKLLRRLDGVTGTRAHRLLGRSLLSGGEMIQVEAQISITRGAVSGAGHVPSAPGEAPNADTHALANYINVEHRAEELEVTVRSDAPYSGDLEFGTSKMAARPFFRPARDKKKAAARKEFARTVDYIVKGGAD